MYAENIVVFGDLVSAFNDLVSKVFPVPKKVSEKDLRKIAKKIETLYERYGENELFRTEFEAWLVSLIRESNKVVVQTLFAVLPIKSAVKEEVLNDLKEAIKTAELQEELEKRGKVLEEKLSKVFG